MVVPVLVAAALLASTSAAGAETFAFGPGFVTFARVKATHGYRVNFSENEKGYLFVRVKGRGSTTDYATKVARAPAGRLVGNFGRRGRFDLRFVPVGKPEALPVGSICTGPKGSLQAGYLIGRAHFRTERGFAQIRIHRVPAARESWAHLVCELTGGLPVFGHPKEKRTTITATASDSRSIFVAPKRVLTFTATEFYRHAKPAARRDLFVAELMDRTGRISVHRKVVVAAPERSLLFPGAPQLPEEFATNPPAPFSGGAEFLRTPESAYTWSGDLAVSFPGLGPIRLAGPRFAVTICALKGCVSRAGENKPSGP
jgi:hypothetical protein